MNPNGLFHGMGSGSLNKLQCSREAAVGYAHYRDCSEQPHNLKCLTQLRHSGALLVFEAIAEFWLPMGHHLGSMGLRTALLLAAAPSAATVAASASSHTPPPPPRGCGGVGGEYCKLGMNEWRG